MVGSRAVLLSSWMHRCWGTVFVSMWEFPPHLCVADSETEPFTCQGLILSLEVVILWNFIFDAWGPGIYY